MGGVTMTGDFGGMMAHLTKLATRGFSSTAAKVAAHLESSTVERFETETDPEGKKWKQSVRAKMTGGQTLTDNANLKNSVTSKSGPDFAAAGTNSVYAAIHNFGGDIKRGGKTTGKMPKRQFAGISAKDRAVVNKIVAEDLLP